MPSDEYNRGYAAAMKHITKLFGLGDLLLQIGKDKKAENVRLYRDAVEQQARDERDAEFNLQMQDKVDALNRVVQKDNERKKRKKHKKQIPTLKEDMQLL